MKDVAHLEQLDADDGEEEDEEQGDNDNVADRLHRDDQTLDHLLQTLGSVNGSQRSQHTEDTKDLEESDSTSAKDRDERDGDDHNIQNVERRPTEGSFVEEKTVSDQLEATLDGEDCGEDVVKILQSLKQSIGKTMNLILLL